MSFSCQKGEFDRFFNRLDRPVEESRPGRQPDRPVDPTSAGRPGRFPSLSQPQTLLFGYTLFFTEIFKYHSFKILHSDYDIII